MHPYKEDFEIQTLPFQLLLIIEVNKLTNVHTLNFRLFKLRPLGVSVRLGYGIGLRYKDIMLTNSLIARMTFLHWRWSNVVGAPPNLNLE